MLKKNYLNARIILKCPNVINQKNITMRCNICGSNNTKICAILHKSINIFSKIPDPPIHTRQTHYQHQILDFSVCCAISKKHVTTPFYCTLYNSLGNAICSNWPWCTLTNSSNSIFHLLACCKEINLQNFPKHSNASLYQQQKFFFYLK